MKEKDRLGTIGIIGHAGHGRLTAMSLVDKTKADVAVVNDAFESPPIPYKINPTYLSAEIGNSFICKGKHQYREHTTKDGNIITKHWICQCGRKL